MLVDVHAHLDIDPLIKRIDRIINNASRANVVRIISAGIDPKSNRKVLELSSKYSQVKPALGLYPTESEKMSDEEIVKEIDFIRSNKPFAISEIGLDLKQLSSLDKQLPLFNKMLDLAEDLGLPVIVHTRQAELQVIETLESRNLKVVLHCYTGKVKYAKKAADLGYYFSIPPAVNYIPELKNVVENISINSLLTETDSPFLGPERGKTNEPANVQFTVKKVAELKGLDPTEVENVIYRNYKKIFYD